MVDILVLRDPKMPHTISMKNGRLYYKNKKNPRVVVKNYRFNLYRFAMPVKSSSF